MRRATRHSLRGIACLLVMIAAGCSGEGADASADGTLIEYRRSGGIRGLSDHLVVSADGRATLERKTTQREFMIDRETLNELLERLRTIDFEKLRDEYAPEHPGADYIEVEVVHAGKAVRGVDTALPPELQRLLSLLDRVVESR